MWNVERAMVEPFRLSGEDHLPPEVKNATGTHLRTPEMEILPFWASQLERMEELVGNCAPTQSDWDGADSAPTRAAYDGIKAVSTQHLMSQLGEGASN